MLKFILITDFFLCFQSVLSDRMNQEEEVTGEERKKKIKKSVVEVSVVKSRVRH